MVRLLVQERPEQLQELEQQEPVEPVLLAVLPMQSAQETSAVPLVQQVLALLQGQAVRPERAELLLAVPMAEDC